MRQALKVFERIEISDGTTICKEGEGDLIHSISLDGKQNDGYRISHKDLKGKTLTIN